MVCYGDSFARGKNESSPFFWPNHNRRALKLSPYLRIEEVLTLLYVVNFVDIIMHVYIEKIMFGRRYF